MQLPGIGSGLVIQKVLALARLHMADLRGLGMARLKRRALQGMIA